MAVLGSLTAILRADTRPLKRDMSKAQKIVKNFKSTVGGAMGTLSKFGALFGGVSLAGIGFWVKKEMEAIDATAKLSDRIGILTEDLTGLQYASELTGAGTSTMNKGLEFMTKALGEATTGVGEGRQALELLGIDLEKILALDPAQQFMMIADHVNDLAQQEQKAYAATKLFGRAGVALVNTMAAGSVGLRKMRQDAEDLGITLTRVEAAQVEEANDALHDMQMVLVGVGRTLAVELAPLVTSLARDFKEWATEGEGLSGKVANGLQTVLKVVGFLSDAFSVLKGWFQVVGGQITIVLGLVAKGFAYAVEGAETLIRTLSLGFIDSNLNERIHDFADSMIRLGKEDYSAGLDSALSGLSGEASREAGAAIANAKKEAKEAGERLHEMGDAGADAGRKTADGANAAAEELKKTQKAAEELAKAQDDLRDRQHDALMEMTPGMKALREELGEHLDLYLELRAAKLFEEAEVLRREVALEKERTEEMKAQVEQAEKLVTAAQKYLDEQEKARKLAAREKKVHDDTVRGMNRELELLRASNDVERERIRIRHELDDAIERANGNQEQIDLARQIAAEKLADLQEDIAENAERQANAAKAAADEHDRIAKAIRDQADITKRFASLPGSGGLFGFGKGRVGGFTQFYQPAVVRRQRRRTAGVAGPKGSSPEVPDVPGATKLDDLSPEVKAILAAWQKVPPMWERLGGAIGELEKGVVSGVDRMGKATEKSVASIRNTVRDLDRRVSAAEKRLERAGNVKAGG